MIQGLRQETQSNVMSDHSEKNIPIAERKWSDFSSFGDVLKFMHVVNNDTTMHAAHTCTVDFTTQSRSNVVSVLILTECAHSVDGSRNKIHGIWQSRKFIMLG